MNRLTITYAIAMAAGRDAGNRHAKSRGRSRWNRSDYNAAVREFNRLHPIACKIPRRSPTIAGVDRPSLTIRNAANLSTLAIANGV